MKKLNRMLHIFQNMDSMEKQLMYKVVTILVLAIIGLAIYGGVHISSCGL